jgi:hypothetical protein
MASTILSSSIGKIRQLLKKWTNYQIQGIAMKTCVVCNIIVKKIKLKHPHKFCQSVPLKADVFANF